MATALAVSTPAASERVPSVVGRLRLAYDLARDELLALIRAAGHPYVTAAMIALFRFAGVESVGNITALLRPDGPDGQGTPPGPSPSVRPRDCRLLPPSEHLSFECTVRLTNRRTGALLEGARLTVNADMPSMPMAHPVRPVQAEPAGEPGTYRLRIALEMPGVWALRLDVTGPLRDVVVTRLDFRSGPSDRPVTSEDQ